MLLKKKIKYYDSFAKTDRFAHCVCGHVKQFLYSNFFSNIASDIDWQFENANTPQQSDGYNSGVYVCQVAKQISRSEELQVKQQDLPIIRKEMVAEIVLGFLFN